MLRLGIGQSVERQLSAECGTWHPEVSHRQGANGPVAASFTGTCDTLGVQRSSTGALASGVIRDEDGIMAFLAGRFSVGLQDECKRQLDARLDQVDRALYACIARARAELSRNVRKCRRFTHPKAVEACPAASPNLFGTRSALCFLKAPLKMDRCWERFRKCQARQDAIHGQVCARQND